MTIAGQRAAKGRTTIDAFIATTPARVYFFDCSAEDKQRWLVDVLNSLLHLARSEGINPTEILTRADAMYHYETRYTNEPWRKECKDVAVSTPGN